MFRISGVEPSGVRIADLDGDGRLELLVHGRSRTLVVGANGEVLLDRPARVGPGIVTDVDGDGTLEWLGAHLESAVGAVEVAAEGMDGRFLGPWSLQRGAGAEAMVLARYGGALLVGVRNLDNVSPRGFALLELRSGAVDWLEAPGLRLDRVAATYDGATGVAWAVAPWTTLENTQPASLPHDAAVFGFGVTLRLDAEPPRLERRFVVSAQEAWPRAPSEGVLVPLLEDTDESGLAELFAVHSMGQYTDRVGQGITLFGLSSVGGHLFRGTFPESPNECLVGGAPSMVLGRSAEGGSWLAIGSAEPLVRLPDNPPACLRSFEEDVWLRDTRNGSMIRRLDDAGQPLATADFDGDGDDELVTHRRGTEELKIYSTRDGALLTRFAVGAFPSRLEHDRGRLAISDLNGDERLELAVATTTDVVVLTP